MPVCSFSKLILLSHSNGSLCFLGRTNKTRIFASKSALPALSVNTVSMQKELGEKTKSLCMCVFEYGLRYFELVVFHR